MVARKNGSASKKSPAKRVPAKKLAGKPASASKAVVQTLPPLPPLPQLPPLPPLPPLPVQALAHSGAGVGTIELRVQDGSYVAIWADTGAQLSNQDLQNVLQDPDLLTFVITVRPGSQLVRTSTATVVSLATALLSLGMTDIVCTVAQSYKKR